MTHYNKNLRIKREFTPVEDRIDDLINLAVGIFIGVLFILALIAAGIVVFKPVLDKLDADIMVIETLKDDIENINRSLEIFKADFPYDPDRQKKLDAIKNGDFNEYGNVEFEIFGIEGE